MIAVNEMFDFCSFIVNKNNSGSFTPKGFGIAARAANMDLYDELRGGRFSTYQPGRPVPTVGMEENMTLSTELDPFIKIANITVTNGIAAMPADFIQNLGIQTNGKKVTWVRKEVLPDHMNSAIDPPSLESPIFTNIGFSWEFQPSTIQSVKLYYLRAPVAPRYDYLAVALKATYNEAGSVHFEWNQTAFMALAAKILSILGVNLSSEQLVGYSENLKTDTK
jgi:hypothetical protein